MGFLDRLFRPKPKLLSPNPSDVQMWKKAQDAKIDPRCHCFDAQSNKTPVFGELNFHSEAQDTTCDGWKLLDELIDKAASNHSQEFAPGLEMPPELWRQIVTLPRSIAKLTTVRKLYLYRSFLASIPPEIGDMTDLEELDLYTSYRLHWLPYEVTRCRNLKKSRFSTRALYGNYKFRPPFPQLHPGTPSPNTHSNHCSVCGGDTTNPDLTIQAWISLRVATDVLPLLVNACSNECIRKLPPPAFGYVDRPHSGGLQLNQPPPGFIPPRPEQPAA